MDLVEPGPPFPDWPRYSSLPFPPYRYVPGLNPHPRLHPRGHSHGKRDEALPPWDPEEWRALVPYLHGVDLYNYAYWWECHEVLEALWHAAGRRSPHARFVQGIILVAAANLNRHRGRPGWGFRQAETGLAHLDEARGRGRVYMGLDIAEFSRRVREYFSERGGKPAPIRLRLEQPA